MKKWFCLWITILLLLVFLFPALAWETTNIDAAYQIALSMFEQGDWIGSLNAFANLGSQQNAADYTAYIGARLNILRNNPVAAIPALEALGDFLDAPLQLAYARSLSQHRFYDGQFFGFINAEGNETVTPQFDWAERSFRQEEGAAEAGLLPVAAVFMGKTLCDGRDLLPQQGSYGLLRADGIVVVPTVCEEIIWTQGGIAAVREKQGARLYDLRGNANVPIGDVYDEIGQPGEGSIPVRQGEKWGYLTRQGNLLPGGFQWSNALPFQEGLAGIACDEGSGFIDETGTLQLALPYEQVGCFGNGLAPFLHKKRWGFINQSGEVIVKPTYTEVHGFVNQRCAVKKSGKWGFIDPEGKQIVRPRYDDVSDYDPLYRRAFVLTRKLWGLLSWEGEILLKPAWSTYTPLGAEGMSCVSYKGKYGYMDAYGITRIPNSFDMAVPFAAGIGGTLTTDGNVRYVSKLLHTFSIEGNMPTSPVNGFIEGRHIKTFSHSQGLDQKTGEEAFYYTYEILFSLHDLKGQPIPCSLDDNYNARSEESK